MFRTTWRRAAVATTGLIVAGTLLVPALASGSTVSIGTLNGADATSGSVSKPVTSTVTATGTARTTPAVIADAGASSAVVAGEPAPLVGIASYGTAPYRFAWTHDGSSSRFADAGDASTTFDTTGLAVGPVTVTLEVTDAEGTTDRDSVLLFVQGSQRSVLVDHTGPVDPGVPDELLAPGAADGAEQRFDFGVPAGTDRLDLTLQWGSPDNDLDLRVDDPSDARDGDVTGATGARPEVIAIDRPAPGGWTAIVEAFLNTPDEFHLLAEATVRTPDPTPVLDAGTYRFDEGAPQELRATVTGGSAPFDIRWDLDGDNLFEVAGATTPTAFPFGTHLVTAKVTDGAGYEKRQTVPVRVEAPGTPSEHGGLVVVAVADSGLNLYHEDFRATTFPDARILELTQGFTRHPSEYLPGYPSDSRRIDLTLSDEYYPEADRTVDPADGRTTLPEVEERKLHWIPGTKIIGAFDAGDAAFVNSTSPDDVPLLDEDGHGTGSASVAVGNLYGYCPTCLLVVTESSDEIWEYQETWIDLASNSFGTLGNVGFAGLAAPSFPRASAERGQIALYAAGNGNENAFVTPQQTYTSETLGPDWSVRVGAVTTGSRKPIVGTGKPVDIASYGSGDIPAADTTSVRGIGSHSGTSAATPYSAGVFGAVLGAAREALGDTAVGQRPDAGAGVIARGAPVPRSPYLFDGVLTRSELVDIVFKTAAHDDEASFDAYPLTTPNTGQQHLLEGYGVVDRLSRARAIDVLLGFAPLPVREVEDEFFAEDEAIRDELWGDWTGGGHDSSKDAGAPAATPRVDELQGQVLGAVLESPGDNGVTDPTKTPLRRLEGRVAFPVDPALPATPTPLFLHRTGATTCADGRYFLDRFDSPGDMETACALQTAQPVFEPAGLGFSEPYALDTAELPAVLSTSVPVTGTIYVASDTASVQGNALPTSLDRPSPVHTLRLRLTSGGEVVGAASVTRTIGRTSTDGPAPFEFSFAVAPEFAGRPLGDLVLEVVHENSLGAGRTVMEGPTTSSITLPLVAPSDLPEDVVEVSVDDRDFTDPITTTLDPTRTRFSGPLDVAALADGTHVLYTRARHGQQVSPVRTTVIHVRRSSVGERSVVQAQVTALDAAPRDDRWSNVTDTSDAGTFATWSVTLGTSAVPRGPAMLHVRVLEPDGTVSATDTVRFEKQGRAPTR